MKCLKLQMIFTIGTCLIPSLYKTAPIDYNNTRNRSININDKNYNNNNNNNNNKDVVVHKTTNGNSYDYNKVLNLSLLFYEAQRSGYIHNNTRIPWRSDSGLNDRGQHGEDLIGGYYDAGDFVKFGFTMVFTTTMLAWGLLSYKDAYTDAGQYKECLNALKWATDYFIKCHVSPNEFYGQIGDFQLDHKYWGRPEDMNLSRPAFKIDADHPGSDLAGEAAAAMASVSLVFKDIDDNYSQILKKHAIELYDFAINHRGLFHQSIPSATQYYESTGYADELIWAALWLFKATNESKYLDEAEINYRKFRLQERPNDFFYDKKVAGVQVLLAQLTYDEEYRKAAQAFCDHTVDNQKRTPKGLVFIDNEGTLSHAANVAFVCLQAADVGISPRKYRDFAKQQINYMLGDTGRSFVVGFGENYPKQPTHAASSCPDPPEPCDWSAYKSNASNPHILYGALVSGPNENDDYVDLREEHIYNEVTLEFNAGFQSAVAGLRHLQLINYLMTSFITESLLVRI